jgi:hypothetical protein
MKQCGSDLLFEKRIVAEIGHHRVKTPLEPAIKRVQVPPVRPRGRHSVPAVELLLKNLPAQLFQILTGLSIVLTFRKQVDRWFSPQIVETQVRTRRINFCEASPGTAVRASPRSLFD